jgi:glycosyltransferase involved in cell wall biosynthesis
MSISSTPSISVIIPCFNQGHYLREAVESVLRQSHPRVEVIIVNDGSTDDTPAVAASFGSAVRYLSKQNAGLPAARNSGILAATGDFLQFLDADDYLLPDTFEKFMAAVHLAPSRDVYFGAWDVVSQDRSLIRRSLPAFDLSEHPLHRYLRGNVFPCHATIVRKTAIAGSGLFDSRLRSFEDWDFWLRLAKAGASFAFAEGAVVAYRQYPGSMSKNHDRMRDAGLSVLANPAILHGDCPECRRCLRLGRREFRFYLYQNLLQPELQQIARSTGRFAAFRRLASACRHDRGLAPHLARRLARNLVRRIIPAQSRSPLPTPSPARAGA